MDTTTPTTRPPFLAVALNYLAYVFLLAICAVGLFLAWPVVKARLSGTPAPGEAAQPAPTLAPLPALPMRPVSAPMLAQPAPLPGIAQNEATSTAMYQATAAAANAASAPMENINTTSDSAPVVREQRAVDRQPASENVPTAEPIQETESDGIFGSKPVIVAPQETHVCKHGQVWTETGCKNPTPTGAQP